MVVKAAKRKKAKIRAYDIDESKKIFLYAYEHQLKNEKINWKKAEELRITTHSAGSMRSHYLNSIKHEISLYLEMYSEEVAKLFAKVKKWKKEEKKKKLLTVQDNFVKQRSNISLDRITKCKSKNYNKFNSLIISKAFSFKCGRTVSNKQNNSLNRRNIANEKRKQKNESRIVTNETNINKNSLKKGKFKQVKIINKDVIATKNKKINKKKKKKSLKSNKIITSTLERTNKIMNNLFNTDTNEKVNKTTTYEKLDKKKHQKEGEKLVRAYERIEKNVNEKLSKEPVEGANENKKSKNKVKEEKSVQIKLEQMCSNENVSNHMSETDDTNETNETNESDETYELNKLKMLHNKNISKNENLEELQFYESRSARRNSEKSVSSKNKTKNKFYSNTYNSKELNNINKSYDSNLLINKRKENKRSSISSIFGYIYKKIFN
ncbi:hypothetical protein MKS88_005088 [Plasmodium brasilianum]|uniref:Uncharacterized protein n=2 Tax=Plasmodium (Plasmodium) TaxID=418103 RepID=A0A1A8X2Z5_PLAMA|nr:conserved Plasmodium protein, unknown function [Plasmodium malariae]KAI4835870.1 hypothetical protein MKS88_005088 [Plasmodium brasilianum]SBS99608.1 conserved Plasmodium protein, unknown function [Plasmodium malariae]SCP02807.1 conserved Plasmodium protein, unknown function [Plasmodium malariae]